LRNVNLKFILFIPIIKTAILISLFLFFLPKPVKAARFYLTPSDITVISGQQFNIDLYLDTENKMVNQVDISLVYPSSFIWIDSVNSSEIFPLAVQDIKKEEGWANLRFSSSNQSTRVNGNYLLASLTLSTHAAGESFLAFFCDGSNNVNDSNVWEADTGVDLISCANLNKLAVHINQKNIFAEPSPKPCSQPPAVSGLKAVSGPGFGEITLYWNDAAEADYYTVTYGLVSRGYIYGAPNIGKTNQYIVSQLSPGRTYYFVITSVNSCGSSGYSAEIAARAGGNLPAEKGISPVQPSVSVSNLISPLPKLLSPSFEPGFYFPIASSEEASLSASFQPSYSPEPFIPPKQEPIWRNVDFWKKVGLLSGILFILFFVLLGLIKGAGKAKRKSKEKMEKLAAEDLKASRQDLKNGQTPVWPPEKNQSQALEKKAPNWD
jgi:hypothetical protein